MEKINSKENLVRLIQSYKNLVFSICLRMTGDYFAAEDLTQETFLSAYTHLAGFEGENEKAWLCRIASNKCVDYMREKARKAVPTAEEELPEAATLPEADPLQQSVNAETLAGVYEKIRQLPEPYKDTAARHFIHGLAAKEIALQDGIPSATVHTRIARAREMLRKSIRKEDLLP